MQNLHTHTTFCDGKNTPEEIIKCAINKGFTSIGFSGHSYMHYSKDWSMSLESTEEYKKQITALKEKYDGIIDVFLGIECDAYSNIDLNGYDYTIGSLHYLKYGDEYIGFDRKLNFVLDIINQNFNGDALKFAEDYYAQLSNLYKYGKFDILGHFDLIAKHIENADLFDEESKVYKDFAFSALQNLKGKIPFFEVNTGCIPRGYRSRPYPNLTIMKEMRNLGFKPVISSDCHNMEYLDYGFIEAKELLKQAGFTENYELTKNGFKGFKL